MTSRVPHRRAPRKICASAAPRAPGRAMGRFFAVAAACWFVNPATPRESVPATPASPATQPATGIAGPTTQHGTEVGRVRHFDFNERPLGNFETVPMHWRQQSGAGLPRYSTGGFDEHVGRNAPPSFRLNLAGGNLAYAYESDDIGVDELSDYLIVAYARQRGLRYARAFVSAVYVDGAGKLIEASRRVSGLIGPEDSLDAWRRLELAMPDGVPGTHALRLELWIAQRSVWDDPDPNGIDPIEHQDVDASVWFDDIGIYRLPRARIRFSHPGGLVLPGRHESILFDVRNFTQATLSASLSVVNERGESVMSDTVGVTPQSEIEHSVAPVAFPVRELPVGVYHADVRLDGGGETLVRRSLEFVVLAELPNVKPAQQVGIDLGGWTDGDVEGVFELIAESGCGAVKIGVPAVGALTSSDRAAYFGAMGRLLRALDRRQVESTGVVLADAPPTPPADATPLRLAIQDEDQWRPRLGPVATTLGPLVSNWQLGAEQVELRDGGTWTGPGIETARTQLRRYVSLTRVVVPRSIFSPIEWGRDVQSLWIPADFPTRSIPEHLDFLTDGSDTPVWLKLDGPRTTPLADERAQADLARRMILALAIAPHRVYVDAPFAVSYDGGGPAWRPSRAYPIVRTLIHKLGGKKAVGVLVNNDQTTAIVFSGPDGDTVALWSWSADIAPANGGAANTREFCLGPSPVLTRLDGTTEPLDVDSQGRVRVAAGAMPVLIEGVRAPLAQLQASFQVSPAHVEATETHYSPRVTFRNYFGTSLYGTLEIVPPDGWTAGARSVGVALPPGETFDREIVLTPPTRQVASTRTLTLSLRLTAPESSELRFEIPFTVGLKDVQVLADARWIGDALVVEQTIANASAQGVSFLGFVQVRGRAREERPFLNIAPGQTSRQRYVFPRARELAQTRCFTGVREVRGERSLDQLVEIP